MSFKFICAGVLLSFMSAGFFQESQAQGSLAQGNIELAAGSATSIPAFIEPGVRLLYESGSSSEGKTPNDKGGAGVGVLRYDIVAISGDSVFINLFSFLQGFDNPAAITFASSEPVVIDSNRSQSGQAPWIPLVTLNALQSGQGLEVNPGSHPFGNTTYTTKVITIKTNNAIERMQFDTGTGLKITQQNATGPKRRNGGANPFNLRHQSYELFKGFRKINLPWIGKPPPAWINTFNSLAYQGTYTTTIPGGPPISVPLSLNVEIKQRGPDWVAGTFASSVQNQQSSSAPFVSAQASIGGLWMSPAVLQSMRDGVIDQDTLLGSTLSYKRQMIQQVQSGVLTESGDLGGYKLQWIYRLSDGVLLGMRSEEPGLYITTEYRLSAIR